MKLDLVPLVRTQQRQQCSGRNIPSGYILLQNGRDAGCAIAMAPGSAVAALLPPAYQGGGWTAAQASLIAVALRESYIQYVPRDDLNKEERREIKYRDYWFQTRRKVAGHGFSFFATTLQ